MSLYEGPVKTQRDTEGGGHVKTETEIGEMQPQPKEHWSHQKLEEARIFPWKLCRKGGPADPVISQLPELTG